MEKNQEFIVKIEDMTHEGEGVGKVDGYALFIKDAVIGELVRVKVIKAGKTYGYGRLMEVITPSPHRTEPKCPIARKCGGCNLQELSYEKQLEFKKRVIENNLRRIGGLTEVSVERVIGMEEPYFYRNKAQFPVGTDKDGRIRIGFYAGRTHAIMETERCFIGAAVNEPVIAAVRAYMQENHVPAYNEERHTGLVRHILIRVGFATGEVMVCLVINGKELPAADRLVENLRGIDFGGSWRLVSVMTNTNREKGNVILGKSCAVLWGRPYIEDCIGEIRYRISPLSFYQVNPAQTKKLYQTALEFAGLTGEETVWDLYCGIGTISLFLAKKAKKVYGVEIVPQAIEDARVNADLNGIGNAEFFVGRAEEVLPRFYEEESARLGHRLTADVIVVDPPRKGCEESLLATMVRMEPRRIVYVSCDSATLARDLKYLTAQGYRVDRCVGCDMFPQSVHVETVCSLVLRKPVVHVNIDVDVEELVQDKRGQATYEQIKAYVLEHSYMKVSSLYIAQVKQKCGIIERENYNLPKSEDSRQPNCTKEKEDAIMEAFRNFGMI